MSSFYGSHCIISSSSGGGGDSADTKQYVQIVRGLPATGEVGVLYIDTTNSYGYIWTGTVWQIVFQSVQDIKKYVESRLGNIGDLTVETFVAEAIAAEEVIILQNIEAAINRAVKIANEYTDRALVIVDF